MNALLASLAAALSLVTTMLFVRQTPPPASDPEPVSVIQPAPVMTVNVPRSKPKPPCVDPLAVALWEAGFRGDQIAWMWAIAWRESRATSIGPGNPHFNGEDYGIFQLNKPTWGHETWWNDHDVLTVKGAAKMAFLLVQEHGFQPWGLNDDGSFDFSSYGGWSDWQRENWIVRPYLLYLTRYWETCYPLEKK